MGAPVSVVISYLGAVRPGRTVLGTFLIWVQTEIPRLPIIHVGTGLVEDDAGIADRHGGKPLPERAGKQGPLAPIN